MRARIFEVKTVLPDTASRFFYDTYNVFAEDAMDAIKKAKKMSHFTDKETVMQVTLLASEDL